MAEKQNKAVNEAQEEQVVEAPKAAKAQPAVYTAAELIAAAPQVFKVSSAIAAGALYGVDVSTKEEAEKRIKEFTSKAVEQKGAK